MEHLHIRTFVLSLFVCIGSATMVAQDLMARQSPVDRRMKSVDSITLERILEREDVVMRTSDLYSIWDTDRAHCYPSSSVPEKFKIDLRGFSMPTTSRKVTSLFGYRPRFKRVHKGIDVKVYTGDTIYAAFEGKIRVVKYEANGYGNYVVIRHNNGLETIYGHLSKHLVRVNDVVKSGQPIGLGGNTGRSFGSHLHFETRICGEPIDPALLFDFAKQDVTGDFFVFKKSRCSSSPGGQALATVDVKPASSGTPEVRPTAGGSHYYKVKRGDSLSAIARKLGTSVQHLQSTNRLSKKSSLRPGQILKY